jgi:hypothetical protein
MRARALLLFAGIAMLAAAAAGPAPAPTPAERPVPRTHSHNDYEHEHPLFDALHHGFASVEADVYLVGADLRVSHAPAKDWSSVPTLQDAYLSPLRDLVKRRANGGVYADGSPLVLLVDIKTRAEPTYARLHEVLGEYQAASPRLFTAYGKDRVTRGAVTVVVTGNRPRGAMEQQTSRLAGYDGRVSDVGRGDALSLVPLISDNWNGVFAADAAWDGSGEMPPAARARLQKLVADVHAEQKMLRLWNLPKDAPAVWGTLYDAGVDLINTDDLPGLSRYLASRGAGPKK